MNEPELGAVRWLQGGLGGPPADAIAYEYLLGDDADDNPQHPMDCRDLYMCLMLIEQVPEAGNALESLAKRSRYWRALHHHWDALTNMLSEETERRMVYPWARRTTAALRDLTERVRLGEEQPKLQFTENC